MIPLYQGPTVTGWTQILEIMNKILHHSLAENNDGVTFKYFNFSTSLTLCEEFKVSNLCQLMAKNNLIGQERTYSKMLFWFDFCR